VGNNDYGVRRFFERAADVLSGLDDATKDLMLSLIDPTSTVQPQSRCTSSRPPAGSAGRSAAAQTSAKPVAKPARVAV
jgi:hypothetical protein